MKKTESTSGARTRLLWASWISVSKSEMARRPRTIARAPSGAAEVDGQAVERGDLDPTGDLGWLSLEGAPG